jgi:hypothetical protein
VPRIVRPSRLPSSIASSAFLRSGDRAELERDRAPLYVVAAELDRGGVYGEQALYWLTGPWGSERVLALEATDVRRRQVAELQTKLRAGAVVGPYVLAHRSTSSGRSAWALVDADESGEQLELGDSPADGSGPDD